MSRNNGVTNGLTFDIPTALEDEVAAYRQAGEEANAGDSKKARYQQTTSVPPAPPPTAREKREVAIYRKHRTAMREGPFFMGDDDPKLGKRDASTFNAFEDTATWSNLQKSKRARGPPALKDIPIVKELLPKELQDLFSDEEEGYGNKLRKEKDLTFLKKKRSDKLAKFEEGADDPAAGDDDAANDDEVDEEDRVEVPEDDAFSEDDEDLGNDYNAEKYFNDGDADDDGGDDAGGDEACDFEAEDEENNGMPEKKRRTAGGMDGIEWHLQKPEGPKPIPAKGYFDQAYWRGEDSEDSE